jgi:xanthine/CO dehydrogenase XdhC/CoxF family maturation factor
MKNPKPIGLRKAIDMMRKPGTRMIVSAGTHYIVPGGHVERDVAEKIKKHPLVQGGTDGLFPGMDQTWRLGLQ